MDIHCCKEGYADGSYVLPPLPRAVTDYEPVLDAETVRLHHDFHHAAYVAGANKAMEDLQRMGTEGGAPRDISAATASLAFNLGGHLLHCIYWHSINSQVREIPDSELLHAIHIQFGSINGFCRLFRTVALELQGSGWALLARDNSSGRLMLFGVNRHQDALVSGIRPLLACDVWEHAYYLRYRNSRAAYVDAFIQHMDWLWASEQFNHACCH